MIYPRENLPDNIIFQGKEYSCDYEWVKIDKKTIQGSNNRTSWHSLRGRSLLSFDSISKPDIVMSKSEEKEPIDYA